MPDEERDYLVADWELERSKCPQCHGPREECADGDRDRFPKLTICHETMAREAAWERYRTLHGEHKQWHDGTRTSWAREQSAEHLYRWDMGVNITIVNEDPDPDGDFLRLGAQSPNDGDEAEPDDESERE